LTGDAVAQWRSQPKFFWRTKKFGGDEMFDFRRATVYFWGYRHSKRKMTTFSKNVGGHGTLKDVVSYCVKRSMSDSVAVLPQV